MTGTQFDFGRRLGGKLTSKLRLQRAQYCCDRPSVFFCFFNKAPIELRLARGARVDSIASRDPGVERLPKAQGRVKLIATG